MLSPFEQLLLALLLFVIMLAMGATLSGQHFQEALKKPKALIIGLLSQFGWMPLIAVLLVASFQLPPPFAIGIIIVGCTPGGTTSNLFTYYSQGNVALSISMTVVSTMVAVIMMPLLVHFYAGPILANANLSIPTANIVSTLVIMLIPVMIGMYIRSKSTRIAKKIEKLGSFFGIVIILYLIVVGGFRNYQLLLDTPLAGYAVCLFLGLIGFVAGYVFARILKQSRQTSRTISIETGIQNTPLTVAVIVASFPAAQQLEILWLPLIYALGIVITSSLVALFFRSRHKLSKL